LFLRISTRGLASIILFFVFVISTFSSVQYLLQVEGTQSNQITYFISINYVPIGSIVVEADPYNMELSLVKYQPSAPQYRQLEQAVFYLLKTSEKYCHTGNAQSAQQALTYYVESTREMYVIKASKIIVFKEVTGDASLQAYNYYPSKYCIPLFGKIDVYKNNVLINELRYTIVSSNNALPESNPLNSGPVKLFVLTLTAVITTISLLVISHAGKYRVI
jgi:hypothetical protein